MRAVSKSSSRTSRVCSFRRRVTPIVVGEAESLTGFSTVMKGPRTGRRRRDAGEAGRVVAGQEGYDPGDLLGQADREVLRAHPLYPSLGIGTGPTAGYAGTCRVRRPCIGPETPSTRCFMG